MIKRRAGDGYRCLICNCKRRVGAQVGVGGNSVAKYPTVEGSKNKRVTNHGVGGNSAPSYSATEASKNKKVSKHGVGGNAEPSYPKVGTH